MVEDQKDEIPMRGNPKSDSKLVIFDISKHMWTKWLGWFSKEQKQLFIKKVRCWCSGLTSLASVIMC